MEFDRTTQRARRNTTRDTKSPVATKRGFAAMAPELRRALARRGGEASGGFANWDPEELRKVSRKGGEASGGFATWTPEARRAVARKGGAASAEARRLAGASREPHDAAVDLSGGQDGSDEGVLRLPR